MAKPNYDRGGEMKRISHMLPAYDLFAGDHVFKLSDPEALRAVFDSISEYNELFKAPVYVNHNPDGPQLGEVESYELRDDGIWATWEIAENVNPDDLPKFVSPRLVWGHVANGLQQPGYRASNGQLFPIVVIELSATGTPVFDIGQNPGITLSLSQTGTESGVAVYELVLPLEENGMTPEQIQALISSGIEAMLAPVMARLDAIEAAANAPVAEAPPAPTPAPVEAMAMDPLKEAEVLMSRAAAIGTYVAELSRKHGSDSRVMRNMGIIQSQYLKLGKSDADALVAAFVATPSAGKVSDVSLSQSGGDFADNSAKTPLQRAKDYQRANNCTWSEACAKNGVPLASTYSAL
jgi:hypothetical protein